MAHLFDCDRGKCINCGACMDVCPVRCLDMTRPDGASIEPDEGGSKTWMMEFPVQIDKCTGCNVCVVECPTEAIGIRSVRAEPPYAETPGVVHSAGSPDLETWVPLSALTREAFRRVTVDPWGRLHRWKVAAHRKGHWQVWRSWEHVEDVAEPEEVKS
jgi:ferredoxin